MSSLGQIGKVLKDIHTLGTCHVLEHITVFEQNHILSTCLVLEPYIAIVTFFRFEPMILKENYRLLLGPGSKYEINFINE